MPVTSGGESGTSGTRFSWRKPAVLAALGFAVAGTVTMIVSAASLLDERRSLGLPLEPWRPWAWEATSLVAWLLLLPLMLLAASRLSPPRVKLPAAALLHILLSIPFSLAHTGLMALLRKGTFWLVDEEYRLGGPLLDVLVYEYRKDALTYAAVLAAYLLARRLVSEPRAGAAAADDHLVEVRDGSHCYWIRPDEIDLVSAAGNYVELNGAFGSRLARRTLADILSELEPYGFVRVHRSHIVRRAAVRDVKVKQSGDFELTLDNGRKVPGSRRFRGNIG